MNKHGKCGLTESEGFTVEIPYKFPSLNDYIRACRTRAIVGANMKKKVQKDIAPYIQQIPYYDKPIRIHFLWVEENKRRDYDNVAFAKKFILDALQENGKLENDNRKWVKGFSDDFTYGEEAKVIITIEVDNGQNRTANQGH